MKIIADYIPNNRAHQLEFLHVFLHQVYFTFIQAIPLMAMLGLFSGAAISLQASLGMALLGGVNMGKIHVLLLFREVAPMMASLIIITRSVTAVASELATMKVGQEIQALQVIGIDIKKYLLGPRIFGGTVSIFFMALTFYFFSIIGAWLGSNITSYFPLKIFLDSLSSSFRQADFIFFFIKTTLIGTIVFHIACKKGLSLKQASFEVPIVTNQAVVDCLFSAIFLQGFLSLIFYVYQGFNI